LGRNDSDNISFVGVNACPLDNAREKLLLIAMGKRCLA
jgi:hypothetical protein